MKLQSMFLLASLSACGSFQLTASESDDIPYNDGSKLSPYFKSLCVVCHGKNGDEGYAPLISEFTFDDYIHSVREGHPDLHIPSFDETEYPTAAIKTDFTNITGKAAISTVP